MSEPNSVYNPNNHYGLPPNVSKKAYGAFMKGDRDHNGSMSLGEAKECLRSGDMQLKNADIEKIFHDNMDLNEDGKVTLDEYMKFIALFYRNESEGLQLPGGDVKK